MYSAINRDVALRPEATLKPKRFKFTPKTVITDVFVAQVYWEAVPKTWPGGSKASVAKSGTAHDLSVYWTSGADVLDLLIPSAMGDISIMCCILRYST